MVPSGTRKCGGLQGPAWASNSRRCSFCDLNSTPSEPCDPRGGQGPVGKEASLSRASRRRAEGEGVRRETQLCASKQASSTARRQRKRCCDLSQDCAWAAVSPGFASRAKPAAALGSHALWHEGGGAPAWVLGRGTHSGQGFLDVLSGSRNVPEDHACAVLLQTVQKEPVFSFIKKFYN